MAKKGGLGKGLDALFVENNTTDQSGAVFLNIHEVEPNKDQPRKDFDPDALQQLATSIAEYGILQPLIVRPLTNGMYQIIAGERRWRAAKLAGLTEIPVLVREFDDQRTMEIALIENLQREDLNAIEEALGYQDLIHNFDFSQEQVANSVGKSRSAVTNAIRLLSLPKEVCQMVRQNRISAGHARAVLSLPDETAQLQLALSIEEKGLSVRQAEALAKQMLTPGRQSKGRTDASAFGGISYYKELELALTQELGRKVKISVSDKKGTLSVEFYNQEDLRTLAEKLV